jgi:hypothetical protein
MATVLGDLAMPYFGTVAQFNGIAAKDWPQLERAYQFYTNENWDKFDNAMTRLLQGEWPDSPNMLVRHDVIHRLLLAVVLPLRPSGGYSKLQKEIWQRAQPSPQLVTYVRRSAVQSEIRALQKRVFRQLAHLIEIRQMWLPVLPFLWLSDVGRSAPSDWRLPGDDFTILRGAYQQNFELSCQALPLLVVAQNAANGRDAEVIRLDSESSPWIPQSLPENSKQPRTLVQFKKLTAEGKEAFLDRFPVTEASWHNTFDRGIRNAIAHADVDQVVATGEITTGKGATLTYVRFVESIVRQLQLLLLWLNLAKLFRVYYLLADES